MGSSSHEFHLLLLSQIKSPFSFHLCGIDAEGGVLVVKLISVHIYNYQLTYISREGEKLGKPLKGPATGDLTSNIIIARLRHNNLQTHIYILLERYKQATHK